MWTRNTTKFITLYIGIITVYQLQRNINAQQYEMKVGEQMPNIPEASAPSSTPSPPSPSSPSSSHSIPISPQLNSHKLGSTKDLSVGYARGHEYEPIRLTDQNFADLVLETHQPWMVTNIGANKIKFKYTQLRFASCNHIHFIHANFILISIV
jgi:hypothetical protein